MSIEEKFAVLREKEAKRALGEHAVRQLDGTPPRPAEQSAKSEQVFNWPEHTKLSAEHREQILIFLQNGDIAGLDNFLDHLIRFDDKLPTMLKHRYFKDEVLKVYARHFKRRGVAGRRGYDTFPGLPVTPTGATTMGYGPGSGMLGLIFVDIDDFKKLNDTKGHLAGDAALIQAGEVISETLREADIKGRFGGEELEIAVELEHDADHYIVAEKIRRAIAAMTVEFEGESFKITVSVGAAKLLPSQADAEGIDQEKKLDQLIDSANWAMKYAKAHGKNQAAPRGEEAIEAWIAAHKGQ